MKQNFLLLYLCDNDYGMALEFAAQFLLTEYADTLPTMPVEQIQFIVIALVLAYHAERYWSRPDDATAHTREYLTRQLRVSWERTVPDIDHDGGSYVIDLHRKMALAI